MSYRNKLFIALGILFVASCSTERPSLAEPAPTPAPTPAPNPAPTQFSQTPIVIEDYSGYESVCVYPSELQPSIQWVIPIDINGDSWEDFLVHQWCDLYRDEWGNIIEEATPDLIVVHLSNGDGTYRDGAVEVFGEPFPKLGGASRKHAIADMNGDNRDDIAFAMNWEDGRNGDPWENSRARPVVILSEGDSGYQVNQLGMPDWGHAVAMVANSFGAYDAVFAGFTGVGLQAFRFIENSFIDVRHEYPPEAIWDEDGAIIEWGSGNWGTEIKAHDDLIIATHQSADSAQEATGFALWKKEMGEWTLKDEFLVPVEFYVDQISWQGSIGRAAVYLFEGEYVFGFAPETMCFFKEKFDDSEGVVFLALFGTNKHKEGLPIVEGETYNDNDFNARQVIKAFRTNGEVIEELNNPFDSYDEFVFANYMDCKDLNNDGYADYARNVFSRTYGYEIPRDKGGAPILYINDAEGMMVDYEAHSNYQIPGHSLLLGDAFNESAGHGQGFFHDVNGDKVIDVVVFGETMRNEYNQYDGSIEVYLGNFHPVLND